MTAPATVVELVATTKPVDPRRVVGLVETTGRSTR
jgi:hypothetical protein